MNWKRSLLLKAASRLQTIGDAGNTSTASCSDALLYNRKLWSIFLTSVAQEGSQLPKEVRQNVANLGLFVMNQTIRLLAEPAP